MHSYILIKKKLITHQTNSNVSAIFTSNLTHTTILILGDWLCIVSIEIKRSQKKNAGKKYL